MGGGEVTESGEADVSMGSGWRIAFSIASGVFAAGAFGGLFGLGLVIGWSTATRAASIGCTMSGSASSTGSS